MVLYKVPETYQDPDLKYLHEEALQIFFLRFPLRKERNTSLEKGACGEKMKTIRNNSEVG